MFHLILKAMLFTGRLTANAEVTIVKGDKKVTNFTVALNHRYKSKDGKKHERSAFVDCAYWINPALAEYLVKGSIVEVSGWVDAQVWTDKTGKAHPRLACNVDNVKLFSSLPKSANAGTETGTKAKAKSNIEMIDPVAAIEVSNDITGGSDDDDDLPF